MPLHRPRAINSITLSFSRLLMPMSQVPHVVLSFLHLAAPPPVRGVMEEALGWETPFRHRKDRDPHAVNPADFPDLPTIKKQYIEESFDEHGSGMQKLILKKKPDGEFHRYILLLHRGYYRPAHWKKEGKGWVICRLPCGKSLVRDTLNAHDDRSAYTYKGSTLYYYHPGLFLQKGTGTATEIIQFCPGTKGSGHFREKFHFSTAYYYVTTTCPDGWKTFRVMTPFHRL